MIVTSSKSLFLSWSYRQQYQACVSLGTGLLILYDTESLTILACSRSNPRHCYDIKCLHHPFYTLQNDTLHHQQSSCIATRNTFLQVSEGRHRCTTSQEGSRTLALLRVTCCQLGTESIQQPAFGAPQLITLARS